MKKELIIHTNTDGVDIALLEDKKLVELRRDKKTSGFSVGDIYLGTVKKLIPGLNAAFVDIGYSKDAFLHYTDLGPKILSLGKFTKNALNGVQQDHMLENFPFERDDSIKKL